MNFFNELKNHWRTLTPREVITRDLAKAHLERLEAEELAEYADACLKLSMSKISRLNSLLQEYK